MRSQFRIHHIRWCSTSEPGKIQIFFRRCDNGARQDQWIQFFEFLGFQAITTEGCRGDSKELWRSFASMFGDSDQRSRELVQNILLITVKASVAPADIVEPKQPRRSKKNAAMQRQAPEQSKVVSPPRGPGHGVSAALVISQPKPKGRRAQKTPPASQECQSSQLSQGCQSSQLSPGCQSSQLSPGCQSSQLSQEFQSSQLSQECPPSQMSHECPLSQLAREYSPSQLSQEYQPSQQRRPSAKRGRKLKKNPPTEHIQVLEQLAASSAARAPLRPPPPPEPPAKQYSEILFREFLETHNVYVKGKDADHNIVGVIRNLIPAEVRNKKENRATLSTSNKSGVLGILYPSPETSPPPVPATPSTVELHRRALALEKASDEAVASLATFLRERGAPSAGLTAEDIANLHAAFRFHADSGPESTWPGKPTTKIPRIHSQNMSKAQLAPVIEMMCTERRAAMSHSYLIADECSWGLPIAVRLFLNSRTGCKLDMLKIQAEVQDLNKWRQQAVANDCAALMRYGSLLTTYFTCLAAIAAAIGAAAPQTAVLLFPENTPSVPGNAAEIVSNRLCQVRWMPHCPLSRRCLTMAPHCPLSRHCLTMAPLTGKAGAQGRHANHGARKVPRGGSHLQGACSHRPGHGEGLPPIWRHPTPSPVPEPPRCKIQPVGVRARLIPGRAGYKKNPYYVNKKIDEKHGVSCRAITHPSRNHAGRREIPPPHAFAPPGRRVCNVPT